MQEHFPTVKKIPYEGPSSKNVFAFKYYNADEVILGKKMKDHLRFSVCLWHTFRNQGQDIFGLVPTIPKPWDDNSQTLDNAFRRIDAVFEFLNKLGIEFYTFHDCDLAPEGNNLEETESILGKISERLIDKQKNTDIRCLWSTQNLFSHPRFMNGGATNPDFLVFCWAAAKTKMALDVSKKLNAENHVFWGGREGYQTLLNTDLRQELDHMAKFLQMAVDYKKKIDGKFQLLIEPKPREPTKHQYDYDAQTVMGFLKEYHLEEHFKLNIEPNHTTLAGHEYEHDIVVSSCYGKLGSIDCNSGDTMVGWDTDQFPMDMKKTTLVMLQVLKQGGLAPGGLNFDCKVRRESVDLEDLFIAHIGGMDCFARGLRNAVKLMEDKVFDDMLKQRYITWTQNELAQKVKKGESSFEELMAYAKANGEPKAISGKQELCENLLNDYLK